MKIVTRENIALIFTPYNPDFVKKIKKSIGGAAWDCSEKCWKVPKAAVDAVRSIMMDVYGETDLPDETQRVTVRITFHEDVSEICESVIIFGKVLARAFGRDSGALAGDDVVFAEGTPISGGSRINWKTIIPEGCIAEVRNVPVTALHDSEEYSYEIVEKMEIDKAALEAERDKLLKRLADIDALLK